MNSSKKISFTIITITLFAASSLVPVYGKDLVPQIEGYYYAANTEQSATGGGPKEEGYNQETKAAITDNQSQIRNPQSAIPNTPPLSPPVKGGQRGVSKGAGGDLQSAIRNWHVSRFVENGVAIDFYVRPLSESVQQKGVSIDKSVEISFSVTDAFTGKPIGGLLPDSFIQYKPIDGETDKKIDLSIKKCRFRAYARASMFHGHPPVLENTYLMCLNSFDNSISVINPLTKPETLVKKIPLLESGNDMALKQYGLYLYVTSESGKVIVIDCMRLKVVDHIDVGRDPYHIKFQPDGHYAWIGNDGDGTVSVIDSETRSLVASIDAGKGHHEFTFTDDSLYAYVTNSGDNSLTVIDVMRLLPVKKVKVGLRPYFPLYSGLSECVYIANEGSDTVSVFDTVKQKVVETIGVGKGVRGLKLDDSGYRCFALNRKGNSVSVIDVSRNKVIKTIPTGIRPEGMVISEKYAYVRNVGSPDVTVIDLEELSNLGEVPIGESPPNSVDIKEGHLDIADSFLVIAPNPTDDLVYAFTSSEKQTSMYKYETGGKGPTKVEFFWIGLKETLPGVYTRVARFDKPGRHEVGFYIESPEVTACFEVNVVSP